MYMRTYIVKATKTGKEWKSFNDGMDFLEDDKLYRLEWELKGFWNAIRGLWYLKNNRKHRCVYEIEKDSSK